MWESETRLRIRIRGVPWENLATAGKTSPPPGWSGLWIGDGKPRHRRESVGEKLSSNVESMTYGQFDVAKSL